MAVQIQYQKSRVCRPPSDIDPTNSENVTHVNADMPEIQLSRFRRRQIADEIRLVRPVTTDRDYSHPADKLVM